ncbi:MAG: cyclic nucleotide-binding domain-containing protein [Cocleimonas sp.]|nr:cyclic nucleotide-binding domain-containing protein [Cocleimonas sp.]
MIEQQNKMLLSLAKNNTSFSNFISDMCKCTLRFIDIRGGESFTLQALGGEDSLYVTKGEVSIKQQGQDSIKVDTADILTQPVLFDQSIEITTNSQASLCHVDSTMLADYLSLKSLSNLSQPSHSDLLTERLIFLKSTSIFRLLPVNVIEEAAKRCEELIVKKGDIIVHQNQSADNLYLLLNGVAETWHKKLKEKKPQMIAILGNGDSFGKTALIIGDGHKSTIKMASNGILLKLSKVDFTELFSPSVLRSVSVDIAQVMTKKGAKIIDVRNEDEYEKVHVPDTTLLPLPELHNHIASLDKDKEYLILCAVGLRAAAATLMLRQQGINASYIEGGIEKWPVNTLSKIDLELFLFDFCPFAQRAVITLQHSGIEHKLTYLDPDNLPTWFDDISPFGKVPILRVDNKMTIFESSVINELLATLSPHTLLPSDPIKLSLCRSWIEFGSTLLGQLTALISSANQESFAQVHKSIISNLQRLEEQITLHGFFSDEDSFSLIDSTYAPLFMRMEYLYEQVDLYNKEDYPHIQAWSQRLLAMKLVTDSVPDDFDTIYTHFILRRGEEGYLVSIMKKWAVEKAA